MLTAGHVHFGSGNYGEISFGDYDFSKLVSSLFSPQSPIKDTLPTISNSSFTRGCAILNDSIDALIAKTDKVPISNQHFEKASLVVKMENSLTKAALVISYYNSLNNLESLEIPFRCSKSKVELRVKRPEGVKSIPCSFITINNQMTSKALTKYIEVRIASSAGQLEPGDSGSPLVLVREGQPSLVLGILRGVFTDSPITPGLQLLKLLC